MPAPPPTTTMADTPRPSSTLTGRSWHGENNAGLHPCSLFPFEMPFPHPKEQPVTSAPYPLTPSSPRKTRGRPGSIPGGETHPSLRVSDLQPIDCHPQKLGLGVAFTITYKKLSLSSTFGQLPFSRADDVMPTLRKSRIFSIFDLICLRTKSPFTAALCLSPLPAHQCIATSGWSCHRAPAHLSGGSSWSSTGPSRALENVGVYLDGFVDFGADPADHVPTIRAALERLRGTIPASPPLRKISYAPSVVCFSGTPSPARASIATRKR